MFLNAQSFLLNDETISSERIPDWSTPVGFASINGDNFTGPVTGGGNSDTVYIYGPSEFTKLVTLLYDRIKAYKNKSDYLSARYAPLTIVLEEGLYPDTTDIANTGSVWGNSMLAIQDQGEITIIGKGEVILNFGINVKRSYNVLIRNIVFQDYYDDGINIGETETHHVWIDHCTFGNPSAMPEDSEHPDGGCDVKNGASYITISWCLFRNSWKTSLVGHSDNNIANDSSRLKTTYYCNYFLNSNSRHPRVRFGEVHVLNCLYENVQLYGIAAANSASVLAEGNFFLNTVFPMYADRSETDFAAVFSPLESYTGNYPCKGLKQTNNFYDDSGLTTVLTGEKVNVNMLNPGNKSIKFDELNTDQVFDPKEYYGYSAYDPNDISDIVSKYAGAGMIDFFSERNDTSILNNVKNDVNFGLKIYPNPVTDFIRIDGLPDNIWNIKISDISGKVLMYETAVLPKIYNVKDYCLQPGFYLLRLENGKKRNIFKLLIE